jgi:hypothetical protein
LVRIHAAVVADTVVGSIILGLATAAAIAINVTRYPIGED